MVGGLAGTGSGRFTSHGSVASLLQNASADLVSSAGVVVALAYINSSFRLNRHPEL